MMLSNALRHGMVECVARVKSRLNKMSNCDRYALTQSVIVGFLEMKAITFSFPQSFGVSLFR